MKDNGFKLTKERSRRYPAQAITDTDNADDIALLPNTAAQAEFLQHSLEQAAGDISTQNGSSLKLVDKLTYLGNSVLSTKTDINRLAKAIDKLSVIWKSDQTDKIKRSFFQAAVVSVLLYGCTTWTPTKRMEKKLDGYYTRKLRAILNKP